MIIDEKKHYWIALFNDYTYDILYNTYQGAIEWCKKYRPHKEKVRLVLDDLTCGGGCSIPLNSIPTAKKIKKLLKNT